MAAALRSLSLLLVWAWPSAASADLLLTPDSVQIDSLFDGAWVRVTGQIPRGKQALVEVFGKRIEEQLLRKGRHWDIWMNVGEVDIEHAPRLYFALTSDPTGFEQDGANAEYGYAALRKRARFKGHEGNWSHKEVFHKFVRLKEHEKLYGEYPGALEITESTGDSAEVSGKFRLPSRVAPGTYQVRLSVLDHGHIVSSETAQFDVEMVGAPAFLASMARKHGALHGLMAVAIALVFGFLVGFVFKEKRREP